MIGRIGTAVTANCRFCVLTLICADDRIRHRQGAAADQRFGDQGMTRLGGSGRVLGAEAMVPCPDRGPA